MNSEPKRIVVIGSGNVATHLATGFENAGCMIVQVYSHDLDHARRLASQLKDCLPIDNLNELDTSADFYLIAICDNAVARVAEAMPRVKGLVAHTSGSVPLGDLAPASERTAVLYPLQTFSREVDVKLEEVPFFTEGVADDVLGEVDSFARMLSQHVRHADSAQRKTLHIAGVLSCNFVNYLWDRTSDVLARDGYDFEVVAPLIKATLRKAVEHGPHNSQTGPAMRCDVDVMRDHASRLDPQTAEIYLEISRAIMKLHNLNCEL